jgi:hypothetical protein
VEEAALQAGGCWKGKLESLGAALEDGILLGRCDGRKRMEMLDKSVLAGQKVVAEL